MDQIQKTQTIRFIDIFILGPFMLWTGLTKSNLPKTIKTLMVISGVATILYNAHNFQTQQARSRESGELDSLFQGNRQSI